MRPSRPTADGASQKPAFWFRCTFAAMPCIWAWSLNWIIEAGCFRLQSNGVWCTIKHCLGSMYKILICQGVWRNHMAMGLWPWLQAKERRQRTTSKVHNSTTSTWWVVQGRQREIPIPSVQSRPCKRCGSHFDGWHGHEIWWVFLVRQVGHTCMSRGLLVK